MHLGNARTFLINGALADRYGWRTIMRIEDLDTPRVKPGAIDATRDTLSWLGLRWDEDMALQSSDLGPFREAMRTLARRGLVYRCGRTRRDIEHAQSAPNEGDQETRFGPELRPAGFTPGRPQAFDDESTNWRLAVEPGLIRFDDRFAGPHSCDVAENAGDFLVWTKRGHPAYQLAVVVDDARHGVTQIVRGDDLLPSAARQKLLWTALGIERSFPDQWHLPLVRGADGRRLAKRHGDTRIDHYRGLGVPAERIVGLIAAWCGVVGAPEPMSTADFFARFDADRMPRTDVVFTEADDRWLIST